MKKALHIITALVAIFFTPSYIFATTNIGYCNGENNKASTFSVEGNAEVSGAIYLTPSFLSPYDGCEVSALRVALATKVNIDRVNIWLRKSLDGENIAITEITSKTEPALAKGWIQTSLENKVIIDASKGLYLGMTYHQKAPAKVFSLVGTGYENTFYMQRATGETWEDLHQEGILSIEMIVEGDVNIDYDLALMQAVAQTTIDSENYIVNVRVANTGQKSVNGFSLSLTYTNTDSEVYNYHFSQIIEPNTDTDVVCSVPKDKDILTYPITVTLTSIDDGTDVLIENNSIKATVPAIKKVFVEEYTTERCGNCPRVARYLHEVMHEEAYQDRVIVVCHHSGYYTDWLTQPCDEEYVRFFNFSFAPAVTYDRYPYFGGLANTPDKSDLRTIFDKCIENEPGVNIAITPTLSDNKDKVTVEISIERLANFNIENPYLTIYLTEDNIQPIAQSGNEDGTHIHQHVIRAYNSTWGDEIIWNGRRFYATYEFDIDPQWKLEDLKIVAIVGNYNPDDYTDNAIDNANEIRLVKTDTSIKSTFNDDINAVVVAEEYYNTSGIRIDSDTNGFVIKVNRLSNGKVIATKEVRR